MDLLGPLRRGPYREPAHVWLYEVRNQTGYSRRSYRYADALVVSVYPSRGMWIAGFECKSGRGDWQRELDAPDKSAPLQAYCDYWWVVAPRGVVDPVEVPERWGYYEIDGKKAKQIRKAPLNDDKRSLDLGFVASVLRNAAAAQARVEHHAYTAGQEAATQASPDLEDRLQQLEGEKMRLELALSQEKRSHAQLAAAVAAYERTAGLEPDVIRQAERGLHLGTAHVGRVYRLAALLLDRYGERLVPRAEAALASLQGLRELEGEAEELLRHG